MENRSHGRRLYRSRQRGATLVEVLVGLGVAATSAYLFFTTVGELFKAKKVVDIKNYAETFEDTVRYDLLKTIMGVVAGDSSDGCLDRRKINFSDLLNKKVGSRFTIRSAKNSFKPGPTGTTDKAVKWRAAYNRCHSQGKTLEADGTSLYACMKLKSVKEDPTDGPFVFAEVFLSLWNLKEDKRFLYCSNHDKKSGSVSRAYKRRIYDFINATKVRSGYSRSSGTYTFKAIKTNNSRAAEKYMQGHLVYPDEYTGNPSRGIRMLYTIYVKHKGSKEGQWVFDITSGTSIKGVNSLPGYCTTRDPERAKFPKFQFEGVLYNSYGNCDFIPDLTKYEPPKNPAITIHADDADKFYPPPPDECHKVDTPVCAPDGPIDCTLQENMLPWTHPSKWHGSCVCAKYNPGDSDYKYCIKYKEDVLKDVDCSKKEKSGHEVCVTECAIDWKKPHCDNTCRSTDGDNPFCYDLCRSDPSRSYCVDRCGRDSRDEFCPDVCEIDYRRPFCSNICDRNPSHGYCTTMCEADDSRPWCSTLCDRDGSQSFCKKGGGP